MPAKSKRTVRSSELRDGTIVFKDKTNVSNLPGFHMSLRKGRKRNFAEENSPAVRKSSAVLKRDKENQIISQRQSELKSSSEKPVKRRSRAVYRCRVSELQGKILEPEERLALYEFPRDENDQQVVKKRKIMPHRRKQKQKKVNFYGGVVNRKKLKVLETVQTVQPQASATEGERNDKRSGRVNDRQTGESVTSHENNLANEPLSNIPEVSVFVDKPLSDIPEVSVLVDDQTAKSDENCEAAPGKQDAVINNCENSSVAPVSSSKSSHKRVRLSEDEISKFLEESVNTVDINDDVEFSEILEEQPRDVQSEDFNTEVKPLNSLENQGISRDSLSGKRNRTTFYKAQNKNVYSSTPNDRCYKSLASSTALYKNISKTKSKSLLQKSVNATAKADKENTLLPAVHHVYFSTPNNRSAKSKSKCVKKTVNQRNRPRSLYVSPSSAFNKYNCSLEDSSSSIEMCDSLVQTRQSTAANVTDSQVTTKNKSPQEKHENTELSAHANLQDFTEVSADIVDQTDTTCDNFEPLLEKLGADEYFGFGQTLSAREVRHYMKLLSSKPKPWRFCIFTFRSRNFGLNQCLNKSYLSSSGKNNLSSRSASESFRTVDFQDLASSLRSKQRLCSAQRIPGLQNEHNLTKNSEVTVENVSCSDTEDSHRLQITSTNVSVSTTEFCPPPLSTKVPRSKSLVSSSRISNHVTTSDTSVTRDPAYNDVDTSNVHNSETTVTSDTHTYEISTCSEMTVPTKSSAVSKVLYSDSTDGDLRNQRTLEEYFLRAQTHHVSTSNSEEHSLLPQQDSEFSVNESSSGVIPQVCRSYEKRKSGRKVIPTRRPLYVYDDDLDDTSDHEEKENEVKSTKKKRTDKKEEKLLQEWAKNFNSELEEANSFELCVE